MSDKIPSAKAGYMELSGAGKDGQCVKVEVAGGISRPLGCCNEFKPKNDQVQSFRCGTCEYVRSIGIGGRL